jgi:adenylate cyclase
VAHGGALKVIGRGSSFQFRGAEKAAARVARALKATHVLDGSVRRSGSRLRISASLIECAGETTLWSERFDRELVDVFELQDEIAHAVAAALRVAFQPVWPSRNIPPEAFDFYLKALEVRRGGLQDGRRVTVITLLRNATALAPAFARAWEFLALMLATHLRFDDPASGCVTTHEEVIHAARTALELDPKLGGAHQALAYLKPFAAFAERETLQKKAVSVTPNDPVVLTNASFVYVETGRVLEGLDLTRRAYHLDPMNPWVANWYANVMDYAGLSGEARALWNILHRQWPDNQLIAWNAIGIAAGHKDWDWFDTLVADAKAHHLDMKSLHPHITYGVALRSPDDDMRSRALRRAQKRLSEAGTLPVMTFTFLYRLGLADDVFRLADRTSFAYMFDAKLASPSGVIDEGLIFAEVYNAEMMRDVRFVGFCAKLGLCAYWVKSGQWPDCADAVAPHYDFRAETRKLVQKPSAN